MQVPAANITASLRVCTFNTKFHELRVFHINIGKHTTLSLMLTLTVVGFTDYQS